ncbi:MAG: Gfo/Idh/MocA family oxidoreductase [Chloroflexi bacterium]|nr:Gfo/Idh/MocA family oxidoreductase [Chloroflexota bacterium]
MSERLRVALVGCGEIGAVRADALARSPDARLLVACDVEAARASAIAAKHRCISSSNWREVVARDDVDIVDVATPTKWHAEIAIAAAEHQKHVLVEKPIARTVDEARQMVAAARACGVKLKTGFNHRYYLAVEAAKRALDAGEIGELMFVRSTIGHEGGDEFLGKWMTNADVAGGGTLLDNGIHILDLTRYFLGEIAEAEGLVARTRWDVNPLEDNAFALFRSRDGKIASVGSSWTEWAGYRFLLEAYGTNGFVRAAYPPMRATIGVNRQSGRPARKRHLLFPSFQVKERLYSFWYTTRSTFVREFADFARAIREDGDVFSSGDDGLRANEMAHAVYESARRGVRVTLNNGA